MMEYSTAVEMNIPLENAELSERSQMQRAVLYEPTYKECGASPVAQW